MPKWLISFPEFFVFHEFNETFAPLGKTPLYSFLIINNLDNNSVNLFARNQCIIN